jgi:hypothetical protein
MVRNTKTELDFDEDELKFFDLIEQHAEYNQLVEVYVSQLKKEMEQQAIPMDKFDSLVKKMQNRHIIKYHPRGAMPWVVIDSSHVQETKDRLDKNICPECKKRTLQIKEIFYCTSCDYQRDKN